MGRAPFIVWDPTVDSASQALEKHKMREFAGGATRDGDVDKLDFEGFDSPLVTKRYAQYMHLHRQLPDGSRRGSDNWQQGIPADVYIKSLVRHMEDLKLHWDGFAEEAIDPDIESVLCAILFNTKGLLFETLVSSKGKRPCSTGSSPSSLESPPSK